MLMVYGGLIGLTVARIQGRAGRFIPEQDKGYLVVNAQLPDGASLERTDAVVARMTAHRPRRSGRRPHHRPARLLGADRHQHLQRRRHVRRPQALRGTRGQSEPERRRGARPGCARSITARSRKRVSASSVRRPWTAWAAPAASRCRSQDRTGLGLEALQASVANVIEKGNAQPRLVGLFSSFSANQPQLLCRRRPRQGTEAGRGPGRRL